jgi:hypothetical protein
MRVPLHSALVLLAVIVLSGPVRTAQDWPTYRDARGRFEFRYPPDFGNPEQGSDDGFRDRVAAVRFPITTTLGNQATLTKGRVLVDVQAAGGLYDDITLQVFPEAMRVKVEQLVPPLTLDNFCASLGQQDHLPAQLPFDTTVADMVRSIDRTRNGDPKVIRCDRVDDVVTFHKEATFVAGVVKARQQIYGAVRFLPAPYSSFQFVRAGLVPPSASEIENISRLVRSFTVRSSMTPSNIRYSR